MEKLMNGLIKNKILYYWTNFDKICPIKVIYSF